MSCMLTEREMEYRSALGQQWLDVMVYRWWEEESKTTCSAHKGTSNMPPRVPLDRPEGLVARRCESDLRSHFTFETYLSLLWNIIWFHYKALANHYDFRS